MDKDSNEFDAIQERTKYLLLLGKVKYIPLGHVNSIPTMQFFTGISRNTQSKSCIQSLTKCVWEFKNNALWDTH